MPENAEIINPVITQVAPAPVTAPAPASADTANITASAPAETTAEKHDKKMTAAFIRQRQEIAELKRKQGIVTPITPTAPATETEPQAPSVKENPPAPAPLAVASIEEEKEAISNLGNDKDLKSMPGAIMDVLDMIDTSPRLKRLYDYDPTLALREAKGIYLAKAGIAPAPTMPLTSTTSGGMGGSKSNLEELLAQSRTLTPGTREFSQLAAKINAEINK